MRWLLGLLAATTLTLTAAPGQEVNSRIEATSRLYTNPLPPPREILDRLNLELAWRTYVPVEGRQDGLFTVQLVDGELYVQTHGGLVQKLDAETGREKWRTSVGTSLRP